MLDQAVQGSLIQRVVVHWILCLGSTSVSAWVWAVANDPARASFLETLKQLSPAMLGSLLILPLAMADMLRMSNRFVGPVSRLKNALRRLSRGDTVVPLQPRRGDYWSDLIDWFNSLLEQSAEEAYIMQSPSRALGSDNASNEEDVGQIAGASAASLRAIAGTWAPPASASASTASAATTSTAGSGAP
jgi:hypothetical protein